MDATAAPGEVGGVERHLRRRYSATRSPVLDRRHTARIMTATDEGTTDE
jgi:hypothetical protein